VVPGGPIPLTTRQAGIAAAAVLAVALAVSLLLPGAAALQARSTVPPGAVVVGRVSFLPADGWVVVRSAPDAVLIARAGTQLLVSYQPSAAELDPVTTLRTLERQLAQEEGQTRAVGGVRTFQTVTGERGYLQAYASPGTTGALGVVPVQEPDAAVLIRAAGPATSFSPLSGEVAEMITGLRLRAGGA